MNHPAQKNQTAYFGKLKQNEVLRRWYFLYLNRHSKQSVGYRWLKDKGDLRLRVKYPLNENSVVFDLGGFRGDWAARIAKLYNCRIFVFEPVPQFAQEIKKRFAGNGKISVFACGLAGHSGKAEISLAANESSLFKQEGPHTEINLVKAADFFKQQGIAFIDLMKINIEGAEYELLDHLAAEGFVKNIGNLQVQFHSFVPNAEGLRKALQEKLALTHELTYCYPFVWENWRLKK